jgi:hypothetical protein
MQEFNNKTTFCRCCLLSENKNGEKLLEMSQLKFGYNNEEIKLSEAYLETTGCFLDGKLSRMSVSVSKICKLCMQQLQSAYVFRQLCLEANEILEKQYESQIGAAKQTTPPEHNNLSRKSNIHQQRMREQNFSDGEYYSDVDIGVYNGSKKVPQQKIFARAYNRRDYSVVVPKQDVQKKAQIRLPGKEGGFSCSICHKSYRLYGSLKSHKLFKHENSNNYKYHCRLCNKKCPTVFILKAHMDTHTSQPTHKCHICAASYKHRTYLLQHLKKHSETNKQFPCRECLLSFKNSRSLKFHQRKVHSDKNMAMVKYSRTDIISKSYEELKKAQKISDDRDGVGVDAMHKYTQEEIISTIDVVKQEMFSDGEPDKKSPSMDLDEEIYANMLVKAQMPPDFPAEF